MVSEVDTFIEKPSPALNLPACAGIDKYRKGQHGKTQTA